MPFDSTATLPYVIVTPVNPTLANGVSDYQPCLAPPDAVATAASATILRRFAYLGTGRADRAPCAGGGASCGCKSGAGATTGRRCGVST